MKIAAVSDLHGVLPEVSKCDLLLIAGDIGPPTDWYHRARQPAVDWLEEKFGEWLRNVPATHIVGIAGNHDFLAEKNRTAFEKLPWTYLQDTSCECCGLKIHGSPWTPWFGNWAFMTKDEHLANTWDLILDDTDILVTHGPPFMCGDKCVDERHPGSKTLLHRTAKLDNLKLHVFGHIHEASGYSDGVRMNVSLMDELYRPVNIVKEITMS